MQVCGDECKVEVLLSNPCAVPIHIDQLSIHATLAPDAANTSTNSSSSSSRSETATAGAADTAAAAGGSVGSPRAPSKQLNPPLQQQQAVILTTPISVNLPPSGKKVKQVLTLTPLQAGLLQLHGLVVEAWGVRWVQPFAEAPKQATGGGGGGGGHAGKGQQQQGPATVVVLPRMPQLQVSVSCWELGVPLASRSD